MSSLHLIGRAVGRPLQAIRFESFYVDGVVSEVYRVVFFRFDSWLRVVSQQGETRVTTVAEPEVRAFDPEGDRLQYPVGEVARDHAVAGVFGQDVVGASEIVMAQNSRKSYGFELAFDAKRLRLLCIDGESMDLSAGRSELSEDLVRRPLLRLISGGAGLKGNSR